MIEDTLVMIKGAGDLASGAALRLHRCGFSVILTELPHPLAIRRTAAFSDAVYNGYAQVEELVARRADTLSAINTCIESGEIPLAVDPDGMLLAELRPTIYLDATVAKFNTGTNLSCAPLVLALGPGFEAGKDVHAIIETRRGHTLGRVIWTGSAEPDTGIPGTIAGVSQQRVIHAPINGSLRQLHQIGDIVEAGEIIAIIDKMPIPTSISGVLRGLIHPKTPVSAGIKIADIDPRGDVDACYSVSDKALAIAGGVLEAILTWLKKNSSQG